MKRRVVVADKGARGRESEFALPRLSGHTLRCAQKVFHAEETKSTTLYHHIQYEL